MIPSNSAVFATQFNSLPPQLKTVLNLFVTGKNDQAIADQLGITPATVRKHIERLCKAFELQEGEMPGDHLSKRSRLFTLVTTYKPQLLGTKTTEIDQSQPNISKIAPQTNNLYDLSEAMDITSPFWEDQEALEQLKQSIITNKDRLLVLVGMRGVGKTNLIRKFCEDVRQNYNIIWKSLRFTPKLDTLIDRILTSSSTTTEDTNQKIERLLEQLNQSPHLLILDDVEAIFQSQEYAGLYQNDYQEYDKFFRSLVQFDHQSSIILISKERPVGIEILQEEFPQLVHIQEIKPSRELAEKILKEKHLTNSEQWSKLIECYEGNPLYLKIIADYIAEYCNGSVADFLGENYLLLGKIKYIISEVFERLSETEKQILKVFIKSNNTYLSIKELKQNSDRGMMELQEALQSLKRRSFLEKKENEGKYRLRSLIIEYAKTIEL